MKNNSTRVSDGRKRRVRFAAWIAALSLLAAGLLAGLITVFAENRKQRIFLENHYEEIAYNLGDSMRNLETNLSKLMVSHSMPENLALTLDTYREAETAVASITSLPVSALNVENATHFLNQIADWSKSYNYRIAHRLDTAKYATQAEELYAVARGISQEVADFVEKLGKDNFKIITHISPNPPRGASVEQKTTSVEYPEMIYDGPFSDAQAPRVFKALQDMEEVSFEAAVESMREKMGGKLDAVNSLGESESDAPVYEFIGTTDRGEAFFSVTKQGGLAINMNLSRAVGAPTLNEEQAQVAAVTFASGFGYDVKPVWFNASDGVAYVNLAPIDNDIVYYTDLVKVKIALDDGGLLGLEASGYCKNHHKRASESKIAEKDLYKLIFAGLKPYATQLCVVPDQQKGEVFCWEIACEYKGLDYFVYINAVSGEQVKILRVVDDAQGKLTI